MLDFPDELIEACQQAGDVEAIMHLAAAAQNEHVAKGVEALGFLNVARLIREEAYIDNPRHGHKEKATEYASVLAVTQLELLAALERIAELEGK